MPDHSVVKGKGLQKKIGPLDVWQYIAIGTGVGVILYVYKKNHGSTAGNEELEKAQKEKELAEEEASNLRFNGPSSAGAGNSGAGGGGTAQSGPTAAEIAALIPTPQPGAPGAPGAPGEAGPPGPSPEPFNNPPTGTSSVAPIATKKPTNPLIGKNSKGEQYKLQFNSKGEPEHVYKNGRAVRLTGATAAAAKKVLDAAGLGGKRSKAGDTGKINHARPKPIKVPHKKAAPKKPKPKPKAKR